MPMRLKLLMIAAMIALSTSAVAQIALADSATQMERHDDEMRPTGKGWGIRNENLPAAENPIINKSAQGANGITYHGGAVMPGFVNVYFIWYGNWTNGPKSSDSQITVALLDELYGKVGGVGGSGYAMIDSTYTDPTHRVSGNFGLSQHTEDRYSAGKNLTDVAVRTVVTRAIQSGKLPKDSNGIYFVLTSSDVDETSGFCKKYCGFHDHAKILNSDIKYAFVGNTDRCQATCAAQEISPNGDSGADGMASIMVHETMEALSNPDLNAWYDAKGQENGDKCAWKWGPVHGTVGYGAYNQTFGNRGWLIQTMWENSRGGGCAQTKGGKFYNF
jgi:hypothetical protein